MRVHQWRDAASCLKRTREFRSREPYLTNVMASVATSLTLDPSPYLSESFWSIEDDREVCGAMMHTAPHTLTLTAMPREAVRAAAREIAANVEELPGVSGPREVVAAFVDDLNELSTTRRWCASG